MAVGGGRLPVIESITSNTDRNLSVCADMYYEHPASLGIVLVQNSVTITVRLRVIHRSESVMTFGVLIADPRYCAVVVDRRVTGGQYDDNFCKVGQADFCFGSFVFGFSGLAKVGRQSVFLEICESVCDAGKGSKSFPEMLHALSDLLERRLSAFAVDESSRRLSVVFSGHIRTALGVGAALGMVSNFESLTAAVPCGKMSATLEIGHGSTGIMRMIGRTDLIREANVERLSSTLASAKHPSAVIAAAVSEIREIASRDLRGQVGHCVSSIWFVEGPPLYVKHEFHVDEVSIDYRLPAFVNGRWDDSGAYIVAEVIGKGFSISGIPTVARVKPPTSRNAPCPCGSNLKYKTCHGDGGSSQLGPAGSSTVKLRLYFMSKMKPAKDIDILALQSKFGPTGNITSIDLNPG